MDRYFASLVPVGRRGLLLIGGIASGGPTDSVEFARIDSAGHLTSWVDFPPLPAVRGGPASAASDRAFYVVAGFGRSQGLEFPGTTTVFRGLFH